MRRECTSIFQEGVRSQHAAVERESWPAVVRLEPATFASERHDLVRLTTGSVPLFLKDIVHLNDPYPYLGMDS